jgi:hypothetical protein
MTGPLYARAALARASDAVWPMALGEIDHGPTRIRCGLAADSSPLAGYLQQRRLHDVLGVAAIAGRQVCRAQQPGRGVAHELVEIAAQVHAVWDTVSKKRLVARTSKARAN